MVKTAEESQTGREQTERNMGDLGKKVWQLATETYQDYNVQIPEYTPHLTAGFRVLSQS